jgi:uncharacterized protein YcbX
MPILTHINVYPLKSCDGQSVEEATLLPSGGLANDRRFALVDRTGEWLNGKRTPALHRLRTRFDTATCALTIRVDGAGPASTFSMAPPRTEAVAWFGEYLGQPVSILENTDRGFPDDTESFGPTLVSTATLIEIASWFGGLSLEETRARFRANLEIDAPAPFWEDRLVAEGTGVVRFEIGAAVLLGTNPCARCPVPSRNPYTGEPIHQFGRIFTGRRQATLPEWAPRSRFDHFYRLSVNTRPASERESVLRVGDELRISDAR